MPSGIDATGPAANSSNGKGEKGALRPRGSRRRRLTAIGLSFAAIASFMVWLAGTELIAPRHRVVGAPPAALNAYDIRFKNARGGTIRGWETAMPNPLRGIVLLLHGVRADRRSMADRAGFLMKAGYGSLMFDFQGHGESDGETITFGLRESEDVAAAIEYLHREAPGAALAAIGSSMGGAACLLGLRPLDLRALVVEETYPDIEDATRNRLRIVFGTCGSWMTPLLLMQIPGRIGAGIDRLRPIDGIARVGCPVMVIGGEADIRTPPAETRRLFDAARDPKSLWIVDKAGHTNFHEFNAAEYEKRVLAFLDAAMPPGGASPAAATQ